MLLSAFMSWMGLDERFRREEKLKRKEGGGVENCTTIDKRGKPH